MLIKLDMFMEEFTELRKITEKNRCRSVSSISSILFRPSKSNYIKVAKRKHGDCMFTVLICNLGDQLVSHANNLPILTDMTVYCPSPDPESARVSCNRPLF